ncbi:transposase [Rhizobacter sp. P5_C2]
MVIGSNAVVASDVEICTRRHLTTVFCDAARSLIEQAVEREVDEFIDHHNSLKRDRPVHLVRNGYLPARTLRSLAGDIEVRMPRVRDRSGAVAFRSRILQPYRRRIEHDVDTLLWCYLEAVACADFSELIVLLTGCSQACLTRSATQRSPLKTVTPHRPVDGRLVSLSVAGIRRPDNPTQLVAILGGRSSGPSTTVHAFYLSEDKKTTVEAAVSVLKLQGLDEDRCNSLFDCLNLLPGPMWLSLQPLTQQPPMNRSADLDMWAAASVRPSTDEVDDPDRRDCERSADLTEHNF